MSKQGNELFKEKFQRLHHDSLFHTTCIFILTGTKENFVCRVMY